MVVDRVVESLRSGISLHILSEEIVVCRNSCLFAVIAVHCGDPQETLLQVGRRPLPVSCSDAAGGPLLLRVSGQGRAGGARGQGMEGRHGEAEA